MIGDYHYRSRPGNVLLAPQGKARADEGNNVNQGYQKVIQNEFAPYPAKASTRFTKVLTGTPVAPFT